MKLPPYGKILAAQLAINPTLKTSINIYCGSKAYGHAKNALSYGEFALALSSDLSPYDYSWPVSGQSIILQNTGDYDFQNLLSFAHALIKAGARIVCVYNQIDYFTEVFNQSFFKD